MEAGALDFLMAKESRLDRTVVKNLGIEVYITQYASMTGLEHKVSCILWIICVKVEKMLIDGKIFV